LVKQTPPVESANAAIFVILLFETFDAVEIIDFSGFLTLFFSLLCPLPHSFRFLQVAVTTLRLLADLMVEDDVRQLKRRMLDEVMVQLMVKTIDVHLFVSERERKVAELLLVNVVVV